MEEGVEVSRQGADVTIKKKKRGSEAERRHREMTVTCVTAADPRLSVSAVAHTSQRLKHQPASEEK